MPVPQDVGLPSDRGSLGCPVLFSAVSILLCGLAGDLYGWCQGIRPAFWVPVGFCQQEAGEGTFRGYSWASLSAGSGKLAMATGPQLLAAGRPGFWDLPPSLLLHTWRVTTVTAFQAWQGAAGFLQPRLVSVTGVLKSHAVTQLEVPLILCRTCPPPPSCDRQVSAPEPGLGCAWWTGLSGRTREAGCPAGRAPPSPGASAVTVISGAAAGPSVLPGRSRGLASHTLLLPPPFLPH